MDGYYNSRKIDFETKSITRDKEGYLIMIRGSISQEEIMCMNLTMNTDVPDNRTSKHMKQKLTELKEETVPKL